MKLSAFPAALKKNEAMKRMIKTTKRIWAILAAAPAIEVKPSTPAIIARIKNVRAQESIGLFYLLVMDILYIQLNQDCSLKLF